MHYLVEAAESEMTVEAFYSKYGYLVELLHHLNINPDRMANPHWLSHGYGGKWFLSRLAYLLGVRLRTTRKTTWQWFWSNVGVLTDDDKEFFQKFNLHGVFDPVLLAVCICSHKERSVAVVGGCGTGGYAWDGH